MQRFLAALALLVICGSAADAQKRCTKGIPCGNTCISATKTCRIGSSAPTPPPKTPATSARTPARDTTVASRDSTLPWVATRTGSTFYLNSPTCLSARTVRSLRPESVVFFKSEEDAKKYGLEKSAARDCS